MILHFLADDKFSDYAISQFDSVNPEENEFVILTWAKNGQLSHVVQKHKVRVLVHDSVDIATVIESLSLYKAIIFHNISNLSQQLIIENTPRHIKIGWVFWGFELYNRSEYILSTLAIYTKLLYVNLLVTRTLKKLILTLLSKEKLQKKAQIDMKIFTRVDYCLTDLHEDFLLSKQKFSAGFQHLWYNYYSIEETVGSLRKSYSNGSNILVGNSATPSNNHLDVFFRLNKMSIEQRKIITPLSYGDKKYGKIIKKFGEKIFDENFTALMDLLDREEYNNIISSCNIVVMYQKRHQGMGNILTAIWLGAKVYLSEVSTTYQYFKRIGVVVFSYENEFTIMNPYALHPLDINNIQQNRDILLREYGKEAMTVKLKLISSTLLK